ncbi:MAG TPA: hypothetical protein ENK19_00765, partial [Acidobacteria bacterium]|nr:hypothetical protein [Acidobacteriota bacterium]
MSNGKLTRRPLPLLAALLLAAVAALVPGNAVRHHRDLSFDGGFNAQVARTLAEKHRYATTYRGLHDFDHRVQTGPTVIVPTAVVFRLVGVNNATAQLTNLAYLLLLFLLTVVLAWRLSGDLAAFLVIPVLLATPHLFTFGMGLYGEIPALVFLLAAALVLDLSRCGSSWWAAGTTGFLLGLAVLTKFQMVLPVAVMVAVAWILRPRDSGRSLGTLAAAATGFAAALVPMELAKLHTFSWPVYLQWWRD